MTASSQTMPGPPPNRRGIVGPLLALIGTAIAIAVIVALIVTWPGHGNGSAQTGASAAPAKHGGNPPAAPAAAFKP